MNATPITIEKVACPTDELWHAQRSGLITASVAGAMFPRVVEEVDGKQVVKAAGAVGFATPYHLYNILKGKITPEDISGNEAIKRGNLAEKLGVPIIESSDLQFSEVFYNDGADKVFYRNTEFGIGATPDFICKERDGKVAIIQLKSVHEMVYRQKWLTDDKRVRPPNWVTLQATIEAFMVALELGLDPLTQINAYVLPVVFSFGIECPFVPIAMGEPAQRLWESFLAKTRAFHQQVADGIEPEIDLDKDGDTVDRVYAGIIGDGLDLTTSIEASRKLIEYNELRTQKSQCDAGMERIKTWFKSQLKNKQVAHLNGGKIVKWLMPSADGRRMMTIPKVDVGGEPTTPKVSSGFVARADF